MTNDDIRVRCAATTKSGRQCKNYAQPDQQYCHIHARQAAPPPQTPPEVLAEVPPESSGELEKLVNELDTLLADLKKSLPTDGDSPYSPLRFLTYIRENAGKLSPEMRLGLLENFEGMTKEDLMDIDTWKGMAYMMSYSARFQADQVREKMNEHLPEPLQPDRWLRFMKKNLDRFTPEIAKNLMETFQGASKEDLMDPDTWKGVWYMLDYSLRFQAEQFKQKLTGTEQDEV
ncbi:MAG: hypothetical protein GY803_24550 [Chloroflexi bacterium]|nr:hypothetical protein [Chloroflexota bacterium]